MSLRWLMDWIDSLAWSTALHESLYVYPLVETTHVLSLMLFLGTLTMVELRLMGCAFRQIPVSHLTKRILPFTAVGFVIIACTGLLLFFAIPVRTYHSIWFRIKIIIIVLSGAHVWFFHSYLSRQRFLWDSSPKPPIFVRISGAISLFLWIAVVVCGRMIAYNWFDCDRAQPDWVITLAGCVIDSTDSP